MEEHELFDRPAPGPGPEMPDALAHLLRFQVLDRSPGLVWALGTLPDGSDEEPVVIDGRAGDDLGALVAVAEAPRVEGDTVSPYAVHRTVAQVSGHGEGGAGWWPGTTAVEGVDAVLLRYRLPHVEALRTVTSTLTNTSFGVDDGFVQPMPMPEPGFAPVPECPPGGTCEEHHTECDPNGCTEFTTRVTCDEDGSCQVEQERCHPDGPCEGAISGGAGVAIVEPVPPGLGQPPPPDVETLPPDVARIAPPDPGGPVEVWNVAIGGWVHLDDVFRDGQADPATVVNPLGEVHVRVRGNGSMVDYSGRGIGALRGGTT